MESVFGQFTVAFQHIIPCRNMLLLGAPEQENGSGPTEIVPRGMDCACADGVIARVAKRVTSRARSAEVRSRRGVDVGRPRSIWKIPFTAEGGIPETNPGQ